MARKRHDPEPGHDVDPELAGEFLDHIEDADPDLYPIFALVIRRGEAISIATDLKR